MDKIELLELLTKYIDMQLDAAKRADVEQMMLENDNVKNLIARLRSATSKIHNSLLLAGKEETGFTDTGKCISDAMLARICDRKANAKEISAIEEHILKCDECLRKVIESIRASSQMRKGKWPEIPEEDRKKVEEARGLVNMKEPVADKESVEKVSIKKSELKLDRFTFNLGSLTVNISLSCNLSGTAVQAALNISDGLTGTAGRLITVNNMKNGRKYFSAKTERDGSLLIQRLLKGEYVIHFIGSELKIELEIED
ncbi:MAG: hypothetical protein ACYTFY_01070 [Planctomycetota bacterium]|jgi:hypothetical protein